MNGKANVATAKNTRLKISRKFENTYKSKDDQELNQIINQLVYNDCADYRTHREKTTMKFYINKYTILLVLLVATTASQIIRNRVRGKLTPI